MNRHGKTVLQPILAGSQEDGALLLINSALEGGVAPVEWDQGLLGVLKYGVDSVESSAVEFALPLARVVVQKDRIDGWIKRIYVRAAGEVLET